MVGEATHHLFARMEMPLAIGRKKSSCIRECLAFSETYECIKEMTLLGGGAAHVSRGDDWNGLSFGHSSGSLSQTFYAPIKKMRDVD